MSKSGPLSVQLLPPWFLVVRPGASSFSLPNLSFPLHIMGMRMKMTVLQRVVMRMKWNIIFKTCHRVCLTVNTQIIMFIVSYYTQSWGWKSIKKSRWVLAARSLQLEPLCSEKSWEVTPKGPETFSWHLLFRGGLCPWAGTQLWGEGFPSSCQGLGKGVFPLSSIPHPSWGPQGASSALTQGLLPIFFPWDEEWWGSSQRLTLGGGKRNAESQREANPAFPEQGWGPIPVHRPFPLVGRSTLAAVLPSQLPPIFPGSLSGQLVCSEDNPQGGGTPGAWVSNSGCHGLAFW